MTSESVSFPVGWSGKKTFTWPSSACMLCTRGTAPDQTGVMCKVSATLAYEHHVQNTTVHKQNVQTELWDFMYVILKIYVHQDVFIIPALLTLAKLELNIFCHAFLVSVALGMTVLRLKNSTDIIWIVMKLCTNILGSEMMNRNDFGDLLTLPLAASQDLWFWVK